MLLPSIILTTVEVKARQPNLKKVNCKPRTYLKTVDRRRRQVGDHHQAASARAKKANLDKTTGWHSPLTRRGVNQRPGQEAGWGMLVARGWQRRRRQTRERAGHVRGTFSRARLAARSETQWIIVYGAAPAVTQSVRPWRPDSISAAPLLAPLRHPPPDTRTLPTEYGQLRIYKYPVVGTKWTYRHPRNPDLDSSDPPSSCSAVCPFLSLTEIINYHDTGPFISFRSLARGNQ